MWLALAAVLLVARALRALGTRRGHALLAVGLGVSGGTTVLRADTIVRFAEFVGLREKTVDTGVESYAHRTLLAYIGVRIWLDRPLTGVGWQASSEEWAYAPFLDDARARFPDEPDQAFPSPEHPWGIQLLYLQVAADLGVAGIAVLLALAATAIATGIRGIRSSPVALAGLGWLLVAAGIWTGIGLVPGLPLDALTWIAFGLVTVRDPV
jgi:O-antigen ligase